MNWRDFFYFSKGERRALILLLSLITIAWIALLWTGRIPSGQGKEVQAPAILHPVCIYPIAGNKSAETVAPATKPTVKEEPDDTIRQSTKRPFYEKPASLNRVEKYPKGTLVELNSADTLILKKVPGIGSAFSNRIVKYRNLLGGYYSVAQLAEVYGIDEEKYETLKEWFCANPQLIRKKLVNSLPQDSLSKHPYINYRQAKIIKQLCRQKGKLTGWENLRLLEEFSEYDCERLKYYISFE